MRILLIHNRYQTRGGEDVVVDAEAELLRGHGHEVEQYLESNDAIPGIHRLTLLARTIWSHPTYKRLRQRIRAFRPQLVHVH
ncbi:MAG: glycosyltransferase family 4 protein, partial [Gammaproteobacteria bacterium]|nr:glycosyltransferase family 4 protein [Gammaproteobacteria bacterium]NIR84104.1 glycosyltransferase family 4 protein [Gammaproteobacteria bacterium]NIU05267.1 glycosyltransferase family 4 protein [Gammaproteobacteria bacterium]NIX86540.1 glycosyltransferase family 1 protein [Gammaproteobacteria bacterium]